MKVTHVEQLANNDESLPQIMRDMLAAAKPHDPHTVFTIVIKKTDVPGQLELLSAMTLETADTYAAIIRSFFAVAEYLPPDFQDQLRDITWGQIQKWMKRVPSDPDADDTLSESDLPDGFGVFFNPDAPAPTA